MIERSAQDVVSDALIVTSSKPGVPKEHYKNLCLGLPDWCPCCTGNELHVAENNPNVAVLKNKERRVQVASVETIPPELPLKLYR